MKILITGPQGSGKTTQAKILAEKLGLCVVKAGDLIRAKAKEETPEGRQLKEELARGDLANDDIVSRLMAKELSIPKCAEGFVVDGYPRSLSQLKLFEPEFDLVIHLTLSDEEGVKRLLARQRADDTPSLIAKRLRWYHDLTEAVVDYYRGKTKVIDIDGSQSEIEVATEIERVACGKLDG